MQEIPVNKEAQELIDRAVEGFRNQIEQAIEMLAAKRVTNQTDESSQKATNSES